MGETLIVIQQGDPTVIEEVVTFLGTGSAGTPGACRRLVFPSSVSALIAPLVYAIGTPEICQNPTNTLNLDNKVLPHPLTTTVRTLGTTKVIRFEEGDDDVIITEIWEPLGGVGMLTSMFRLFYDYLINASLIDTTAGPFITWEPRDRTTRIYNVEILSLTVGAGTGETRFNVRDVRPNAEVTETLDGALSNLSPTTTGIIDDRVELRMKIISEV